MSGLDYDSSREIAVLLSNTKAGKKANRLFISLVGTNGTGS